MQLHNKLLVLMALMVATFYPHFQFIHAAEIASLSVGADQLDDIRDTQYSTSYKLEQLEQLEKALESWQIRRSDPDYTFYLVLYAQVSLSISEYENSGGVRMVKAKARLMEAIELTPGVREGSGLVALAGLSYRYPAILSWGTTAGLHDVELAETIYDKMLKLYPQSPLGNHAYAEFLVWQNKDIKAREFLSVWLRDLKESEIDASDMQYVIKARLLLESL